MIKVNKVTVSPSHITLYKGRTETYDFTKAEVEPSNATCKCVCWVSSDPRIAAVNETTGHIYAVSAGTARIFAIACDGSGVSDYCTVTVEDPVYVESILILPSYSQLAVGAKQQLNAKVSPDTATNKCVHWSSNRRSVATVDPLTGVVTAVSTGTAIISATACDFNGVHESIEVKVVPPAVPPTGISLEKTSEYLVLGETTELNYTVYPTEGSVYRSVQWTSSNPEVAKVHQYLGRITALKPGTTTITATTKVGNYSASCLLTVPKPPTWIDLSKTELNLKIGQNKYLVAYVMSDDEVYGSSVCWSSSDSSIASVDANNGKVTALSPGFATITATTPDGNVSANCKIRVIADTVTISAHENTNKVVFDSTGKTWYCINHDMLFGEEAWNQSVCEDRLRFNYFTYYDETNPINSDTTPREYTDDEIKLLYAIDPYGVAAYINEYASRNKSGLKATLQYKDDKFKLLFNREPKYFARTPDDGTWYETKDKSDLTDVLSESETIFGVHMIRDEYIENTLKSIVDTIIRITISTIVGCYSGVGFLETYKNLEILIQILIFIGNFKSDGFISAVIDGTAEPALKGTSLFWAPLIVSVYSTLTEIVNSFDFETTYYRQVFDYCIDDLNYEINMRLQTGETYKLQEISELIANK